MVAIKAEMTDFDSSRLMIEEINRIEALFKQRFPEVLWLFFEPDIAD